MSSPKPDEVAMDVAADEAVEGSAAGTAKKGKLVRPRGKRGGAKNRKAGAVDVEAAAKKASKSASSEGRSMGALAIARYHALEKEAHASATTAARRAEIAAEQEALGGLKAYQDASIRGGDKQKGGETGKWLAETLAKVRGTEECRILDVGAIAGTAYAKFPWVSDTPIDLNPRSARVIRADFFQFPAPDMDEEQALQAEQAFLLKHAEKEEEEEREEMEMEGRWRGKYDVVALSLVVNFVGDLRERGRMLLHAHSYLKPSGRLYLVLPRACVSNSRYLTHERLTAILGSCGWDVERQDDSKRLTRWLCTRKERVLKSLKKGKEWDGKVWKKEEVHQGKALNNFAILVGGTSS